MIQTKAKVIKNIMVAPAYYKILLGCPGIARAALPGQFINIKVSKNCEPLLRRPLSIHRVKGQAIEMLYEVLGKGTQCLSEKKAGEWLDIIGPLGNGFTYPLSAIRYPLILVAGGMGVAPLVFLAERLACSVKRRAYKENEKSEVSAIRYPLNAKVLIGGKTKRHILCEKEFKDLGCDVKIATDNGSRGFHGRVADLLRNYLLANWPTGQRATIYACGPKPMLKEISRISQDYKIATQISLEEHMACGIGACLGCVINTTKGFKRVCKEGPVFDAKKIVW